MSIVWVDDVTELDAENMNQLEQITRKGVANGYASLGADGLVPPEQLPPVAPFPDLSVYQLRSEEGVPNGYAPLGPDGKVPAAQLPPIPTPVEMDSKLDRANVSVAGATVFANKLAAGHAQPAFSFNGDGKLAWGVGGATVPDTTLYRRAVDGLMRLDGVGLSANLLKADLDVTAGGSLVSNVGDPEQIIVGTVTGAPGLVFGSAQTSWLYLKTNDTLATNRFLTASDGAGTDQVRIGTGAVNFGGDFSLVRVSATGLRLTNASLDVARDLIARNNTASQVLLGDIGGKATIAFSNAYDTLLYRNGAGVLRTDGILDANGLTINGVPVGTGGSDATKVDKDSVVVAATRIVANKLLVGDANQNFRILGDGKVQWGAGGALALDTNLYRLSAAVLRTDTQFEVGQSLTVTGAHVRLTGAAGQVIFGSGGDVNLYRGSADVLKTDDALTVTGALSLGAAADAYFLRVFARGIQTNSWLISNQAAATDNILSGEQAGDANTRFTLQASGRMSWGSGAAAGDTNLYRSGAAILKTDGQLYTGSYIAAFQGTANETSLAQARVNFYNDTALYRSAVGTLKTDGTLALGSNLLMQAGTIFFGAANDTYLTRLSANALKTPGSFDAYAVNVIGACGISLNSSLTAWFDDVGQRRLLVGPADSGGAGFRAVKVPN